MPQFLRGPSVARCLRFSRPRISRRERRIAELIRLAQTGGTCDPDPSADAIARYTTALTLGLMMVRSLDLDPPDPEEWARVVGRTVGALRPASRPVSDGPTALGATVNAGIVAVYLVTRTVGDVVGPTRMRSNRSGSATCSARCARRRWSWARWSSC